MAVDCSADSLNLARENAVGHAVADAVTFAQADLLPATEPPFDLILANLPYIPSSEIDSLPIAASFEPRLALDGGPDGLLVVRRLLEALPEALAPAGAALIEIGSTRGRRSRRLPQRSRASGGCWIHARPFRQASIGPRGTRGCGQAIERALMVMPELPIRLIALDIDGTLVGDDLVIGERTLAVIAEATGEASRFRS